MGLLLLAFDPVWLALSLEFFELLHEADDCGGLSACGAAASNVIGRKSPSCIAAAGVRSS